MSVPKEPQNQKLATVTAAEDLSDKKYHFIDAGGNLADAGDTDAIGTLWTEGESGEAVSVQVGGYGLVRCPAGSKINTGDLAKPDANGQAVAATTADDIGWKCVSGAADNGGLAVLDLGRQLRVHA